MPTSIKLSKITKVNLRDCWENEATDFTPWLASEENIAQNLNVFDIFKQEGIFAWHKGYTDTFATFFKPIINKLI